MTEPTRRLARAADIKLKRRGVLGRDDHLQSAESQGFIYRQREHRRAVLGPAAPRRQHRTLAQPEPLSPAERETQALEILGLAPGHNQPELPIQVTQIADDNR